MAQTEEKTPTEKEQKKRRPYEPPTIESEALFESVAADQGKDIDLNPFTCTVHSDS